MKQLFFLHLLLMFYSISGICSKKAAAFEPFSFEFIFFYGLIIVILGIYAIFWQQIIKRIPLTTAYANKAVTVVWGIIWGILFFGEAITIQKVVGAVIIILGISLFAASDKKEKINE